MKSSEGASSRLNERKQVASEPDKSRPLRISAIPHIEVIGTNSMVINAVRLNGGLLMAPADFIINMASSAEPAERARIKWSSR